MKALVIGTCGAQALVKAGQARGDEVDSYLYGFRPQQSLDPIGELDLTPYEFTVVIPTLRNVIAKASGRWDEFAFWRGDPSADILLDRCDEYLGSVLDGLAKRLSVPTRLVLGFLEPSRSYLGQLHRFDASLDFKEFVHDLNKRLRDRVQELENLWFVDPNPVVDGLGRTGLQDDVLVGSTHAGFIGDFGFKRDIARLVPPTRPREVFGVDDRVTRYGEAMWDELTMLVDVINSPQQVKLIIVDLDDTLWRGTAAEDDFDLNERRSGWPFGMVEALLIYKRRGGLLAICSKNSRADTLVRFDEIWGQLLDLDDFASIHISWDPKPEGIARILADVNVLPANTLFFDDNPRELAEVKARFPTINLCGENHYLWRSQILFAAETQVARVTGEGVARTSLVQGRVKREASKKELSRDDWLRSLELSLTVQRVTSTVDKAYTRAFELLNKTNQFNTTGKRWSETELADLFAQSGYLVTASLSDCFVDNGLVGVTVVRGETIEQAVLSCRVFGLEAEIGMLKVVCDGVLDRHSRVVGKLVTTDSNLVCRNIYQLLGFTQHDEGYVTSESPAFPEWMRLVEPATESSGRD